MKVYTGTGDKGRTSLFSGERRLKCDGRIDAYGQIDELNAFMGHIKSGMQVPDPKTEDDIDRIQRWLLDAGAWLATSPGSESATALPPFSKAPWQYLEQAIDTMSGKLPVLRQFILPQGHGSATSAHVARTVCRRAERRIIALFQEEEASNWPEPMTHILIFLNRLSDYLFVLSRHLNRLHGLDDIVWKEN